MDALLLDLRYALRQLRRSPGFTTAAAVSLALGIGANTTIFSAVNALLVRSVAAPNADRLVRVYRGHHSALSYPEYAFSGISSRRSMT